MTYFLDFDRTLFDTVSFKKTLSRRFSLTNLREQFKTTFTKKVTPLDPVVPALVRKKMSKRARVRLAAATYSATGRFGFTPQELRNFLYPEVPEFLEKHGKDIIIVTYGVQSFITAKVTSALDGFVVKDVVYTPHRKGPVIKRLIANNPGPFVFCDDMHFQLHSVAAACPEVQIFEMRRGEIGTEPDGTWPVVHSLTDLP